MPPQDEQYGPPSRHAFIKELPCAIGGLLILVIFALVMCFFEAVTRNPAIVLGITVVVVSFLGWLNSQLKE